MKKTPAVLETEDDPLDREIDFSKSRPNPYWLGVVDRQCVRLLDKELADIFPDNASVNEAMRTLVRVGAAAPAPAKQKLSAKTATAPRKKGRS
jgi:hypothetical protein